MEQKIQPRWQLERVFSVWYHAGLPSDVPEQQDTGIINGAAYDIRRPVPRESDHCDSGHEVVPVGVRVVPDGVGADATWLLCTLF